MSFRYLDTFLRNNADELVEVDPESIDIFYGYDECGIYRYSVNLTERFVASWWNYDCPMLFRFKVNKDKGQSIGGLTSTYFVTTLVEMYCADIYLGDITRDEADKLIGDRLHTKLASEVEAYFKAKNLKDIEVYKGEVNEYEKKLQEAINNNKIKIILGALQELLPHTSPEHEIIDVLLNTVDGKYSKALCHAKLLEIMFMKHSDFTFDKTKEHLVRLLQSNKEEEDILEFAKNILMAVENFTGLDCGWINIYTDNKDIKEKINILRYHPDINWVPWLGIRLPVECKSTTIKKAQFNVLKKIVSQQFGESLYSTVVLD